MLDITQMTPFRLIEIALASWYIAFAFTSTDGPRGIFHWIREHVWHGRHGFDDAKYDGKTGSPIITPAHLHDGLLDCIICLAPWVALALWLVPDGVIIWAFAAAGLALMLHSWTGWKFQ